MSTFQQQSGYRSMPGEQLAMQAQQAWQQIQSGLPSKSKQDLEQVVEELTQRVQFVSTGTQPGRETIYSSLDATALALQTRSAIGRVSRELPYEQKQSLDIVTALADRIEAVGSGTAHQGHGGGYASQSQQQQGGFRS